MELLSVAAAQEFNDHPRGVDPVLRNVVICLNDAAPNDLARTRLLLDYVLADPDDLARGPGRLYGTDDGRTRQRMRIVFDLRSADQIRGYLMGLARRSAYCDVALAQARALLDRLIDPDVAMGRPFDVARLVPAQRSASSAPAPAPGVGFLRRLIGV
jgi:hypothetical protein